MRQNSEIKTKKKMTGKEQLKQESCQFFKICWVIQTVAEMGGNETPTRRGGGMGSLRGGQAGSTVRRAPSGLWLSARLLAGVRGACGGDGHSRAGPRRRTWNPGPPAEAPTQRRARRPAAGQISEACR